MHKNAVDRGVKTMRDWVKRRESVNKPWTSDELWARIKKNWPTMPFNDQELVFQSCIRRNVLAAVKEGRI